MNGLRMNVGKMEMVGSMMSSECSVAMQTDQKRYISLFIVMAYQNRNQ
jgi:hypothetical protein